MFPLEYNYTSVLRHSQYTILEDFRSVRNQHPSDLTAIDMCVAELMHMPEYHAISPNLNTSLIIGPQGTLRAYRNFSHVVFTPRLQIVPASHIYDTRNKLASRGNQDGPDDYQTTTGLYLTSTDLVLIYDIEPWVIRHELAHMFDSWLKTPRYTKRWFLFTVDEWERRAKHAENPEGDQ